MMRVFRRLQVWLQDATSRKSPLPGQQASSGSKVFGHDLVLPMVLSVTTCIALGLIVAWINLNRFQMGYALPRLQAAARKQADIQANLKAERENILSRLGLKAEELGLYTAKPGQVRRMGTAPEASLQDTPLEGSNPPGEQATKQAEAKGGEEAKKQASGQPKKQTDSKSQKKADSKPKKPPESQAKKQANSKQKKQTDKQPKKTGTGQPSDKTAPKSF